MKQFDSVVIGAGVSGLSAAMALAKNGLSVALIEQKEYIGPLLHRFKRSGAWCDPGFHYSGGLGGDGTLSVLFRYLGIDDEIEKIPLPGDGFDIIVQDGKEYKIPYGLDRFEEFLCKQFPASREAIQIYVDKLKEIAGNTGFLNFELEFDSFPEELYKSQSLNDFLIDAGAEEALIRLLSNHGMVLYGSTAEEVPVFVNTSVMGSFYKEAHTIRGGGDSILKAMKSQLGSLNVELFLGDGLKKINIDDKRNVCGVELESGTALTCDTCISTLHPWVLADVLPKDRVRPAFISRLKNLRNTFSPYIAFYKLDHIPDKIRESNYYIFKEGAQELEIAFMAANQKAEFSGQKALAILKPVPETFFKSDSAELYKEQKQQMQAQVANQTLEIFPELKGKMTYLDGATSKTIYRYTRSPEGSIYGIKPTVQQMNLSSQTSVRNLYMAGQSVQSGVMGAIISALMAVGNIVGMDELRRQVVKWV